MISYRAERFHWQRSRRREVVAGLRSAEVAEVYGLEWSLHYHDCYFGIIGAHFEECLESTAGAAMHKINRGCVRCVTDEKRKFARS